MDESECRKHSLRQCIMRKPNHSAWSRRLGTNSRVYPPNLGALGGNVSDNLCHLQKRARHLFKRIFSIAAGRNRRCVRTHLSLAHRLPLSLTENRTSLL
jgi:hypothetical protein